MSANPKNVDEAKPANNRDNDGAKDPETGTTGAPQTGKPYEIAPEDAHMRTDSKDERSIKNKIVDAHREEKKQEQADEDKQKTDPTEIARSHGNEPSRGAKIDKKIEDDEEELLRKKDEAKKQAEEAAKGKGHGK